MVSIEEIRGASEVLAPIIRETPLLTSPLLNEIAGGTVLLKAENLQRTGSFKFRGAYNLLSRLSPEQKKKGVIAFSSGNHAQAVAAAGTMLDINTTIVMPEDAPQIKIDNTRRLGGTTVLYDRYKADRETIAREMAAERGCEVVPSFDHPHIIAGQGTAGLEIVEQCHRYNVEPDQVLVNCSGGGLTAGCAVAIREQNPATTVHPVEPADFDDTCRSLASGTRETNSVESRSICDALQVMTPGEITFEINRRLLGDGYTVSDQEVRQAIYFAFRELKLVVEPGGAASLAAVLSKKIETRDQVTVAVLSGGNIDPTLFQDVLNENN